MPQQILYVDPVNGRDTQSGQSAGQPLKTISAALRRVEGETTIQLKAGLYTSTSGEEFPLVIPPLCRILGETGGDRPAAILNGGGPVQRVGGLSYSATCRLEDRAVLQNVTVINRQPSGVGMQLEAGRPRLEKVVCINCAQFGAIALAQAMPILRDCVFESCGQAGIAFVGQSKGFLEQVVCQKNQAGIRVEETAAPVITGSRLEQNEVGLAIAGQANPVLRGTRIINNTTYGLQLLERAIADIGQSQDMGNNILRNNGRADIRNATGRSLTSCGNDVLPQGLEGPVELVASDIPDPSAVPALLFDQPVSLPPPAPPAPVPPQEPAPGPQGSTRFRDMANHWAGPFVDGLVEAGVVAGFSDGTFRPNQSVTRAEFASFFVSSFPNQPIKRSAPQFRDVPRSFWGYEALSQAYRVGALSGFPDGTMRPGATMTRIQAIVAIANGLGLSGGQADAVGIYRDRALIPSYAIDPLSTATQRRLVVNYPEPLMLRPLEPITRGEVSALIYQGRVAIGQSDAIASPYIVQPDTSQPLFTDLSGHWAAEFIRELAEVDLVSGMADGRFAADAPMNRAQFAALIVRAFQPPPQRESMTFRDVPPDYWAAADIQTAYRGRFLEGFPDYTFAPDHPLLRVQTWVALVNGLDWNSPSVNLNPLGRFTDYTTIPRYALQQTAIADKKNLIANYPNPAILKPNQVATRADVCVAVHQVLVALQRLPAISSRYLV